MRARAGVKGTTFWLKLDSNPRSPQGCLAEAVPGGLGMRKLLLGLAICAVAMAPRWAFGEPPADVKPSPDVAWLVIGIQPATVRMEIDEPWVKNGEIFDFHYNLNAYHPVDGYIIVKAQPDKPYGVAASSLMFGKSIFGIRYKPCGQVPTFHAGPGQVIYVTTINYHTAGAANEGTYMNFAEGASYSQNLEGARAFLKAHYPGLADSLQQGQYEMVPVARKCR